MLRVPNVLCRSMGSTSNVDLFYPSGSNFVGRDDGLDGTSDNGNQYTTAPRFAESALIETHQDWILQKLKELTTVRANVDAQLRELQDLYHKQQYALAQQRAAATTTIPFTTTPPYSTPNIFPHPFSQPANLPTSQGETCNIPHPMSSPSTSQLSTAPYAQPATLPPPKYTVRNYAGKKVFRCECGHEASRKGDMKRHCQSLGHAKKSYICPCGKGYTRKDSLLRHATTHMHESHVF